MRSSVLHSNRRVPAETQTSSNKHTATKRVLALNVNLRGKAEFLGGVEIDHALDCCAVKYAQALLVGGRVRLLNMHRYVYICVCVCVCVNLSVYVFVCVCVCGAICRPILLAVP